MPEPFFFNETSDPAKLSNRQRGYVAELAFTRKAASLGLPVAKPLAEGERYDFIVRVENVCWRVQVKSVLAKAGLRKHYRIGIASGARRPKPYSPGEIDFLVAYIFPENTWYVFPATMIEGLRVLCVRPGSKRSRFEQYREAWKLMKPSAPEPVTTEAAAEALHGS